jgi:hypothetical protein
VVLKAWDAVVGGWLLLKSAGLIAWLQARVEPSDKAGR